MQGQKDMREFVIQAKALTKSQLSFIHSKVLKFIIEDSQPFYILESKSFKELLLSLHLFFEMPTDEALEKLLDQMFNSEQTKLKKIFEKFYRGKSDGVRGAGVGLAICLAIMQAHRGTIEAFNRAGGGAIFRICLPLAGVR